MPHTDRQYARAAGALYLVTHVTSVVAVIAYGKDALKAGITLEFALAIACAGTGVLVWQMLRQHGPARAATFALLRAVEAAVIIAGTLPMAAAVIAGSSTVEPAMEDLHTASFLMGQGLVISINTIALGWLLATSGRVPRALGLLGMAGGAIVMTSNLSQLWGLIELNGTIAGAAAAPIFAFELWFAFFMLIRGLRPAPVAAVTGHRADAGAPVA